MINVYCHTLLFLHDSYNQNQIFQIYWSLLRLGLEWPLTCDWSLSRLRPHSLSVKPSSEQPRDGSISQNMCSEQRGRGGWLSAALLYSVFCLNWKKEGLMRTCKGISKEHIVIPYLLHLYMSLFNIYISLLDWTALLALGSSVCFKR